MNPGRIRTIVNIYLHVQLESGLPMRSSLWIVVACTCTEWAACGDNIRGTFILTLHMRSPNRVIFQGIFSLSDGLMPQTCDLGLMLVRIRLGLIPPAHFIVTWL